jgi:hypothetical protein
LSSVYPINQSPYIHCNKLKQQQAQSMQFTTILSAVVASAALLTQGAPIPEGGTMMHTYVDPLPEPVVAQRPVRLSTSETIEHVIVGGVDSGVDTLKGGIHGMLLASYLRYCE